MNIPLIKEIAAHIRDVDGSNRLDPAGLGERLASRLHGDGLFVPTADLTEFLKRTNPDKTVGAGALAELIVAEFDLDEE